MNIQWISTGALFSALLGASVAMADTTPKIGYVDMQKAISSTSAGKKAKENLEKDFNKRKKELEKMEEDLRKAQEDLEKKAMVLSDDVKAKKQQSFQEEMLKYREAMGKSQMEIQKKERDLTMPILKDLRDMIEEVAKEQKFTMVLEKSEQSVMWAQKDLDLTDEVVKRFEKKKK